MDLIYDNIIFDLQKSGGISVYWTELASRMLIHDKHNVIFIETKRSVDNHHRSQFQIPESRIVKVSDTFINRLLPISQLDDNKQIFHSSYYRNPLKKKNKCIITTIHDFIPEIKGRGIKRSIIARQKYESMKYADGIICVSRNTKDDLLKLYPEFNDKKIIVIYNGVSSDFFQLNNQNFEDKLTKSPYCLYIGKREKYKNFKFVVDFMEETTDLSLVIVGGGELNKQEKTDLEKRLNNRYVYIDYVSNTDLNLLYNQAEFLFYPSDYEGFGIPILEAQRSGCPFIAQNTSSIRELVINKNLLLESLTIDNVNQIRQYINLNRELIINEGIENSQQYTWENSFHKHIEFYEELFSNKFF